jgi:ABC-type polysaccharide/polyol phosphate export permease
MAIFTIVFTRVVPLETGLPYPVYAYAGLLPWTSAILVAFVDVLVACSILVVMMIAYRIPVAWPLLNPMTPIIDGYRDALLRGQWPEPAPFVYAAVVASAVLLAAAVTFHRAEPAFAENT